MTAKSLYPIVIVFDLDDTLYKEINYLRSAFQYILTHYGLSQYFETFLQTYQQGKDAFEWLISNHLPQTSKEELIELYRNHIPSIALSQEVYSALESLSLNPNVTLGIITDGRTRTQLNKIGALGLYDFISDDHIIISERFGCAKPNPANYLYFMENIEAQEYWYVGDNVQKDFIAPNQLKWKTICLNNDGLNIHAQNVVVNDAYLPQIRIDSLSELLVFATQLPSA